MTTLTTLLSNMSLDEKIGQMCQRFCCGGNIAEDLAEAVRAGQAGSMINETDLATNNELQRIAVEESRLGIPLLFGRDVIHGFRTIFPIPLGLSASWDLALVSKCSQIAALEAASAGINWTFAPMIDIARDPRWGRIAESPGEDPYLCSRMAEAMIRGFQGDNLADKGQIAACAKHFAGYGASESGRDYHTTNIPENELRNVHLRPFKAAADAGVATFMSSFSDLNGVPATGNEWLLKKVLRQEWAYSGFVVSDWDSVQQLVIHGLATDNREAAFQAAKAGVAMEMVGTAYHEHLSRLVEDGSIPLADIDTMVMSILQLKSKLGLFENPYTDAAEFPPPANEQHLAISKQAALKSCVLLKNENDLLPLNKASLNKLAIIGPLADDGYEQLGTWVFDGNPQDSTTCLQGIRKLAGTNTRIEYARAMETSRSHTQEHFAEAVELAKASDVAVLFLGEESILSGEAHCRSNIDLPGCQEALIEAIAETGKPIVLVVMAGRPLTLEKIVGRVDAILYAWHPGTMGGEAIADLLFGVESPSGKLPVTFPRVVGQIPLYYGQKHGGKPASQETFVHMDEFPVRAEQTSMGMSATHMDTHFSPLFHFGYGLSYTKFEYQHIALSAETLELGQSLIVSASLSNTGTVEAEEIVQLYIRDLVGSVTRPVKELKGFQRVRLAPGQQQTISFTLETDDLAFFDRNMEFTSKCVKPPTKIDHPTVEKASATEMA